MVPQTWLLCQYVSYLLDEILIRMYVNCLYMLLGWRNWYGMYVIMVSWLDGYFTQCAKIIILLQSVNSDKNMNWLKWCDLRICKCKNGVEYFWDLSFAYADVFMWIQLNNKVKNLGASKAGGTCNHKQGLSWLQCPILMTLPPVCHTGVLTWKCFLYYWPIVRRIHWSLVKSPYKGPVMYTFDIFCY